MGVSAHIAQSSIVFSFRKDNTMEDVKYLLDEFPKSIAVSSMITEIVKGKTFDEAMKISKDAVAEALGGLPPQKMHCSNLGADALKKAIEDYLSKKRQ
ncbi:MAG: iron-sulfur cluster assembly scaffold protein [Archaeoglobaceae archaeon]